MRTTCAFADNPYIRVKYEDICERPLEETRRIVSEAGLDPAGVSVDFMRSANHAIGNGRDVRSDSSEIAIREDWKTSLGEEQLEIFERIAGEANRSLGYTS